ncbi:helix-turn-helix domain-containing protein [Kitasatospora sp. CB02891]|uniref:helix-turn-helix domain-containing protein n=1 Tax=Kitasatospora sp. CB02891 TaxID=2020329 RepID=UPI000C27F92D|nr:helix-turn-helix domain-containing protein [Kitasatospora sp. CB02891]PJN26214.1 hypothetical protein CG736_12605 [Kitasatospora sp. CB02891]
MASAFVPMAVEFLEDEPPPGTIVGHRLGQVRILQVKAGPQMVTRTRQLIAREDAGSLILTLQQRGTSLKEQDGRETSIRPGEFSITDASRVFRKRVDEDFTFTSFHFPRAELDVHERDLRALTATTFGPGEGSAALVATYLAGMAREAPALDEAVGRRAAATALDLLALLIDDRCGRERPKGLHGAASLERVKDHIRRNLGDPDLSPETIARAHHISLRHLHRLFEDEETTVSRLILRSRLDASAQDLSRPGPSVAAVAQHWGFGSPAHFSRAFRAAYGVSPSQWRAQHTAGRAGPRAGRRQTGSASNSVAGNVNCVRFRSRTTPPRRGCVPRMTPDHLAVQLADPIQRRVFSAVALGATTSAEVLAVSGLAAPDAAPAIGRLVRAGLLVQGRGTVALNEDALAAAADAAARRVADEAAKEQPDPRLRGRIRGGVLVDLPEEDQEARRAVLGHLAGATFAPGEVYDERTVTDRLRPWCEGGPVDAVALRRALVDDGLLARGSGRYRLNP